MIKAYEYRFRYLRTRVAALVASATVLLCAAGCRHIPLYDGQTGVYMKVELVVDSQMQEKIDQGKAQLPGGLKVLFFNNETHEFVAEDFLPLHGGFIDVPVGTYNILVYTVGNETTIVRNTRRQGTVQAYTNSRGMSLMMTRSDEDGNVIDNIQYPIVNEPDYLYVGTAENMFIPPKSDISETVRIHVELKSIVETWTFIARDIDGADRISHMSCYVTGQIQERYLWDLRYSDNVCAIPFAAGYDVDGGMIKGEFTTFGKHPMALSEVFLNVQVVHADGALYQWIFNVTDQFTDPDNTKHELIVTEKIVIPDTEAGGLTPHVNDWSAEITNVPL